MEEEKQNLDWVADLSSARFYQGRIGERLKMALAIHDKWGPMVGNTITGLTHDECEFYIEKMMDIQGHCGEARQKKETLELYEEVMSLIELRIRTGEY